MSKLSDLRKQFSELGIDAVILFDEICQRYFSNFHFTDGYILITQNKAYLVTDFRYYEMALNSVEKDFEVMTAKREVDLIGDTIASLGINNMGFEGGYVSYSKYKNLLDRYPSVNFVDISDALLKMRQIKTPDEIDKIQKAQDIADKAFENLLNILSPAMTEIEVAAELEYQMKKLGSEMVSFDTIAVSGSASALPHGTPRNLKLERGFLTMDFGAKHCGYCSDMTRTISIGKADNDMRKLYNTVLSAQLAAIEYLASGGRDCGLADKAARDIIEADFPGTFLHSLGHSVGLLVHESPSLTPRALGQILHPGNVVTVEPGIYIFGKHGCRIEDMVAITDTGIHNFANSPKDLIEIL